MLRELTCGVANAGIVAGEVGNDIVRQRAIDQHNRGNHDPAARYMWASDEAGQSLADQLFDIVAAFWSGNPRNFVK
jgi:hypothetical protein